MPIIKGKADKVVQRDGQKGPYWFVTVGGKEYYTFDSYFGDKQGQWVTGEHYTTRNGKDALKSVNGTTTNAPAPSTNTPSQATAKASSPYPDRVLDKAFTARTMSMSYSKDTVRDAYQIFGPEMTDEQYKTYLVRALKGYMILCDTITQGTDLKKASEVLLDAAPLTGPVGAKVDQPQQSAEEKHDNRPALKRMVIELAANVGVIPVKAAKKYIGRAIKSIDDLTEEELQAYVNALTKEKEANESSSENGGQEEVPF